MSVQHPRIFISAVSSELRTARSLAAQTLTFLGYEPVMQDIFGTESGDLREVLRRKIDDCHALIQLVGDTYGVEPPTLDAQFGRCSYTQYEALYAAAKGLRVYYILISSGYPKDNVSQDEEPRATLQKAYRENILKGGYLYHSANNSAELENRILYLRHGLEELRVEWRAYERRLTVRHLTLIGFLLIGLSLGGWQAVRLWRLHNESQAVEMQILRNSQLMRERIWPLKSNRYQEDSKTSTQNMHSATNRT